MSSAVILFFGLVLDAIIGDPKWLWSRLAHPIVLIGQGIGLLDKALNNHALFSPTTRRMGGIFAVALMVALGAFAGILAEKLPAIFQILILAILLAHKSLCQHVSAVGSALAKGDIALARRQTGQIVGRNSEAMTPPEISRAAIESAAENLSDGVIAPIFWFLTLGLPGVVVYKIVNTADSMVGYKSAHHADFGWASARLDDLVNWIPARLSAVLLLLAFGRRLPLGAMRGAAHKHRSPNAGWPEAVMAYGLGVALSGPRHYEGRLSDDAFVNPYGKAACQRDIEGAVRALWRVWALVVLAVFLWMALHPLF